MDFNGYYSFDQNALPQTSTTDLFGSGYFPSSTSSYTVDEAALQQTLTDLNTFDEAAWQSGQPQDSQWSSASPFATGSVADTTSEIVQPETSHDPIFDMAGFSCDWPCCASPEIFIDTLARSHHVADTHIVDVLNDPSRKCTWPGCTSKSVFRTFKLLEAHVNNIHINPLCCTVPLCKHKRPFSKQGDLDRHILSVHNAKLSFKCPYLGCSRHARGFPRKDKLKDHTNTLGHGSFHCKYHHCKYNKHRGLFSLEDIISHELSHPIDGYECAIGSCKGSSSCFEASQLLQHLKWQHDFRFHAAKAFCGRLPGSRRVALDSDIDVLMEDKEYHYIGLQHTKTCKDYGPQTVYLEIHTSCGDTSNCHR